MRLSESGFPLKPVYGVVDAPPPVLAERPGEFPFTRGVYASMYTARPWTMRQYAGFATARESNQRYRELVAAGTGGLSVAFDLPTQMGYDSDDARARGEVGRVGVAVDSIDDMQELFRGLPLDEVSTSMTINSTAATLLLMYQLVAAGEGIPGDRLTGTIQNDILKEYIARGTYIYPPKASLRLASDIFAFCHRELPNWNTISISGYHMAEAGASPVQEIAFTLSNAKEYVRTAIAAGLDVDDFAPRLSFFFVARTTLLEEVAKFRAARRMWARIMRDEFGARNPKSMMLRFHTQTAGVQLTAQQPEANLVRVAIQGLAAVLGGTQSLHTNSFDEAIALPTPKAARLALRTQQILAFEADVTGTVDPFAGSYAIEAMTDEIEAAALRLMEQVDDLGGAAAAIEVGFQKAQIEDSAYRIALEIDDGTRTVVGVNRFTLEQEEPYAPLRIDPAIEAEQCARLADLHRTRDNTAVTRALGHLARAATGTGNVLIPMREALTYRATGGEVANTLREVWGEYTPGSHVAAPSSPPPTQAAHQEPTVSYAQPTPLRYPVLADVFLPSVAARTAIIVTLGAVLTALCAQIAVPIPGSPVPVTGQTFAVLITAAAAGPVLGLSSQVLYLVLGAIGLPVFAHGSSGLAIVTGVTAGYFVGFVVASVVMGAGSRRGTDRSFARELVVAAGSSASIYLFGASWLAISTGMSASAAFAAGVTPFLVGDALKVIAAALLLPVAWKTVDRITPR